MNEKEPHGYQAGKMIFVAGHNDSARKNAKKTGMGESSSFPRALTRQAPKEGAKHGYRKTNRVPR